MTSYCLYIMRVTDKGQFLHTKVSLNHLIAPLVEKDAVEAEALLGMALYGLTPEEFPRKRCDLINLCLVPPVEEVGVVP